MTDDTKKEYSDGGSVIIEQEDDPVALSGEDNAEELDYEVVAEEFCASTGLIEGTTSIEMQDDNMYIVLTKEEVPEGAGEGMGAVGVALLSSNGGDQYLAIIAAGMCELLRNDPDLLIHAGYEFMDRASGVSAGTETVQ